MTAGRSEPDPPEGWGRGEKLAGLFFAAFLLCQLTIPVFMLTQPRPARFGWHMYSTVRPIGVFVAEDAAGGKDTLRVNDHLAGARSELDYVRLLPPYLCAVSSGTVAIRFERRGAPVERYVCP